MRRKSPHVTRPANSPTNQSSTPTPYVHQNDDTESDIDGYQLIANMDDTDELRDASRRCLAMLQAEFRDGDVTQNDVPTTPALLLIEDSITSCFSALPFTDLEILPPPDSSQPVDDGNEDSTAIPIGGLSRPSVSAPKPFSEIAHSSQTVKKAKQKRKQRYDPYWETAPMWNHLAALALPPEYLFNPPSNLSNPTAPSPTLPTPHLPELPFMGRNSIIQSNQSPSFDKILNEIHTAPWSNNNLPSSSQPVDDGNEDSTAIPIGGLSRPSVSAPKPFSEIAHSSQTVKRAKQKRKQRYDPYWETAPMWKCTDERDNTIYRVQILYKNYLSKNRHLEKNFEKFVIERKKVYSFMQEQARENKKRGIYTKNDLKTDDHRTEQRSIAGQKKTKWYRIAEHCRNGKKWADFDHRCKVMLMKMAMPRKPKNAKSSEPDAASG